MATFWKGIKRHTTRIHDLSIASRSRFELFISFRISIFQWRQLFQRVFDRCVRLRCRRERSVQKWVSKWWLKFINLYLAINIPLDMNASYVYFAAFWFVRLTGQCQNETTHGRNEESPEDLLLRIHIIHYHEQIMSADSIYSRYEYHYPQGDHKRLEKLG